MDDLQNKLYTQLINSLSEAIIVLSCDFLILNFNTVAGVLFNNKLSIGKEIQTVFSMVGFTFPVDKGKEFKKIFYTQAKEENSSGGTLKYIRWHLKTISFHKNMLQSQYPSLQT